jgi:hypothetical protein
MHLDQIVPIGRSGADYRAMFALERCDRGRRLLGCGDGPAAFNADWTGEGGQVVSLDPLYGRRAAAIRQRIAETFPDVVRRMKAEPGRFALKAGDTIDALASRRWQAMQRFLADLVHGSREGRYVAGALPRLPFADGAFDLALCSHLLFLHEAQLSQAFHLQALRELLRVAGEVRAFPLVNLNAQPSTYLAATCAALAADGVTSELVNVDYEVQHGARHMLRLVR